MAPPDLVSLAENIKSSKRKFTQFEILLRTLQFQTYDIQSVLGNFNIFNFM